MRHIGVPSGAGIVSLLSVGQNIWHTATVGVLNIALHQRQWCLFWCLYCLSSLCWPLSITCLILTSAIVDALTTAPHHWRRDHWKGFLVPLFLFSLRLGARVLHHWLSITRNCVYRQSPHHCCLLFFSLSDWELGYPTTDRLSPETVYI